MIVLTLWAAETQIEQNASGCYYMLYATLPYSSEHKNILKLEICILKFQN